jgi:hypothetical protein
MGLDFDTDMRPVVGYQPQLHRGERRALLKLLDEDSLSQLTFKENVLSKGKVYFDTAVDKQLKTDILDRLNTSGGFMELPFPLEFKTMSYTNKASSLVDNEWFTTQATGQTYSIGGETYETYGMPILPQNLRCGQSFQDGTARAHEYTTKYVDIYRNAIMYMACQEALLTETDNERRALFENKMAECVNAAQAKFDEVTSDIAANRFNTKYNVVREEIMANRIEHSATAVWSADPRLDIDQVAMSREHAMQLGLCDKDGNLNDEASVLVWRDPILHDGNLRYMRVTIDDSLHGVAINPLMDQSFDGDFDGDSVAIVPLTSKEAQRQAYTLFSVENNLLNRGVKDKDGNYPIYCQSGLDVASNAYSNPKIKTWFNELTVKINELERKAEAIAENPELADTITYKTRSKDGRDITLTGERAISRYRRDYCDELNNWAHAALEGTGTDYIDFTDEKSVMSSLQHIVDTGAKGSQKKLKDAADNMGIEYKLGTDGRVDLDTIEVLRDSKGNPVSRATYEGKQRETDKKIQETAAYKADNTQLGGTIAQHGVDAFRDVDLTAALELTYPVTQAILQSKHDPKDAKIKDEIIRFWGSDCWDGYKLTGDWENSKGLDSDGFAKLLQDQKHQRVTEFVLDPKGNKIPVKERVPELNADGDPLFDSNGKPRYTYVDKVDRDGNPVYETTYVKCTPEEWKAQMKGMFTAFKVDINADFLDRLADAMTREEPAPVVSVRGNDSIIFYSEKGDDSKYSQKPIMGNEGTVMGLMDFAREKGTLLDSVAYFDRFTALVNESLKGFEPYREAVSSSRMKAVLTNVEPRSILTDGIEQGIKMKELEQKRALLPRQPKTPEEKAQVAAIRDEMKEVRSHTCCSSSFTPDGAVSERYGDFQREESGDAQNTFIRIKKGEATTMKSDPKPIGCKGSFLRKGEYEAGAAFMGEAQADYEMRVSAIQATAEPTPTEAIATQAAPATPSVEAVTSSVEPIAPVDEVVTPKRTAKKSAPLDKVAAAEDGSKDIVTSIDEGNGGTGLPPTN